MYNVLNPSFTVFFSPGAANGNGVVASPQQVVLRNKDKGQVKDKDKDKGQSKVRFGSVKDKLRRHKSSLELHRPASLETLLEGSMRGYGSTENLSHDSDRHVSTISLVFEEWLYFKKNRH
jgi:hypothetical protein